MRRTLLTPLVVACAVLSIGVASAGAYSNLKPGSGQAGLTEQVPVNFVFVGYDMTKVDPAKFLAELPPELGDATTNPSYRAIVRSRLWYGVKEFLGLDYTYDYSIIDAPASFETDLFGYLSTIAVRQSAVPTEAGRDITLFQQQYNDMQKNVLDVSQNYFIDAPSVEKWLVANSTGLVDTTRNTIFFINWWGNETTPRAGFKFHTYTKFGEPDPDTGYDFGIRRQSRKIIAWGGTPPAGPNGDEETGLADVRRIWFHDLSAGPESWSLNYNVDTPDADGDGKADYIIPAVWEYLLPGGYGPRNGRDLGTDLGKLARFGAINLLFTSSPLYPPYLTPPRQPGEINLDLNTYEGWKGVDVSATYQKPAMLQDEVAEVHRIPYSYDEQDFPLTGDAKNCYLQWIVDVQCYNNYRQYPGFANLFLYNALNKAAWRDDTVPGTEVYEAGFFNYATDQTPKEAGFLGFADDNWQDGTQSGTFNFISPGVVALGYGLTTTQIHEYGHHFGMSHPHDGYDFLTDTDYGPEAQYIYAWSTDEVNSIMSYIDLNWDYSQFDRDNANRFQAAAYWIQSNTVAEMVLATPSCNAACAADLQNADNLLGQAKTAMANHDYVSTFDRASEAYGATRAAAVKAGVPIIASDNGWVVGEQQKNGKGKVKKGYAYIDKAGPGTHRGAN